MGRPKQLLPLGKKPVIAHCLESIVESGVPDIVVVLGPSGDRILEAIRRFPITVVYNKEPASEMAESVRTGLRVVDEKSSGVLICLSDHPLVSEITIRNLIAGHREDPEEVIIPVYRGRRGHPTLFPKQMIEGMHPGLTLRDIVRKGSPGVKYIEVPDRGVVTDLDTEEDYRRIHAGTATPSTDR